MDAQHFIAHHVRNKGNIALKYIVTICCLLFAIFSSAPATAEQVFFSTLQDIPLMPELEEISEQSISFDKPEGRIAESIAIMHDITERKVLDFYRLTLPQFGWGLVNDNLFFRKSEFLEIDFERHDSNNLVKIMIRPTL